VGSDSAQGIVESAALEAAGDGVLDEVARLFGNATVERTGRYALVGAVGKDLAVAPGALGAVLAALAGAGIDIHYVGSGYSRSSFFVAVDEDRYEETVRIIYTATA
jgi:aspartokinase